MGLISHGTRIRTPQLCDHAISSFHSTFILHVNKSYIKTVQCFCDVANQKLYFHILIPHRMIRLNSDKSVCNFQSMKSLVELNSLFSKLFCYITWFSISPDQTRQWATCKLASQLGLQIRRRFITSFHRPKSSSGNTKVLSI